MARSSKQDTARSVSEVGSEFWSFPDCGVRTRLFPPQTEWFVSGRSALSAIVMDAIVRHGVRSAALPSWCCESMVMPFEEVGIAAAFYPVTVEDSSLKQDLSSAEGTDLLLLMGYFGMSQPPELPSGYNGVVVEDVTHSLLSAYRCMHSNLADDGSIYVWHADTEGLNFRKAFKDAGFYLSGCCIWKKNSLVLGRSPYQWIHEPCLFGWKQKGKHQWYSDRKQTTVWEYDKPRSSKDHPTMKPVTLMSYPIKNSTMTNGIVLDPFLGSGSTLIACMETDRICRGIELDPKFVDVIVKRAIEHEGGRYDDVYVVRDGQKLRFDEVAAFEPQEVDG